MISLTLIYKYGFIYVTQVQKHSYSEYPGTHDWESVFQSSIVWKNFSIWYLLYSIWQTVARSYCDK